MSAIRTLAVLALFLVPATAGAHIVVTSPTPRVDSDSIKEAAAPCGGPRGSTIHQLEAGQMLTLEYDETIAHPGHFELNFSMAGDANWTAINDNIADQGGVGSYEYTFQVPDVECTDCTFQFVQVMTDRNPPTNYYSCIDVEISAGGGTPDVGVADMGSDAGSTNNSTTGPGNTNGNTGPSNNTNPNPNNVNPPGPDLGSDSDAGPTKIDASGTCAVAGDHPARNNPIAFTLAILLIGGITRWRWGR